MSETTKRRLALAVFLMTLATCAFAVPGFVDTWDVENEGVWGFRGLGIVAAMVFGGSGALLAYRRTENPVGWLFSVAGLSFALLAAIEVYVGIPLIQGRHGGLIYPLAWFGSWAWVIFMAAIAFAILLFPTGDLPGPRWRLPAVLMVVAFALGAVSFATGPGLNNYPDHVLNRYALPDGTFADAVEVAGMLGLVVAMATAVTAVVARFRASRGLQRQQMKMFALAAAVMGGAFLLLPLSELELGLPVPGDALEVAASLAMMAVPLGMTIAILRYRLYDIDVVINRTLVYGALTAALLGSYLLLVFTLGRILDPITRDSDVAVAASTLAVAALFRPLRARIQAFIDRRFYRARYDATRAVTAFAARLRDEIEVDMVRADVLNVVSETVQPRHASLWMRDAPETAR